MSNELNPIDLDKKFYSLRNFQDLANLLDISRNKLYYYTYKADKKKLYKKFYIPKKSGGMRVISAPSTSLKILQQKLNRVLQAVYTPKASVHGFVLDKSILTNAKRHLEGTSKKRFILNVDLEDFFPSITLKRILGLLMAVPYNLPYTVASAISHLCCFGNELPQGAPTSPILSNMICAKLDTQIRQLAQQAKCVYTRYADDITISTTLPRFPSVFAKVDDETQALGLGDVFQRVVEKNGFKVNNKKIRLQSRYGRQEITGLTVNKFPNVRRSYVRQIRAMLHAWEKYGLTEAQREYQEKYYKYQKDVAPSFKKIVRGKIEFLRMVRGEENQIYISLSNKLRQLDPEYKKDDQFITLDPTFPVVLITEGKTDWKHLKGALSRFQDAREYTELDIEFWEFEDDPPMGQAELLKRCQNFVLFNPEKINICIFDRDDMQINNKVSNSDKGYRKWADRLYSFSIPVPSHRTETPDISLEFYYQDDEITMADQNGKRLFISNEFDPRSLRHLINEYLSCRDINKITKGSIKIIDQDVYNGQRENVALSKNSFASNILEKVEGFNSFEIREFRLIFNLIKKIIKDEYPETKIKLR